MKVFGDQHSLAPDRLVLTAMWKAGAHGSAVVYQDQGDTLGYQSGEYTLFKLALQCGGAENSTLGTSVGNTTAAATKLTLTPSGSGYPGAPTTVRYVAKFRGAPVGVSSVACAGCAPSKPGAELQHWYEPEEHGSGRVLVVETPPQPARATVALSFL